MTRFPGLFPLILAVAAPALAEGQLDRLFPADGSCYLRQYDEAHLARAPDQTVTDITIGPYGPRYASDSLLRVKVLVAVRGGADFFTGYAECKDSGLFLFCAMLDSSGSFSLTPEDGGKVRLELVRDGAVFKGETGFIALSNANGDEIGFLLSPAQADSCP